MLQPAKNLQTQTSEINAVFHQKLVTNHYFCLAAFDEDSSKRKILYRLRDKSLSKRGFGMVKVEWKPLKEIDPNREHLAFSQYGELKSTRILLAW